MAKERPIERIARNRHDYKYCDRCGKINGHENKWCHGCGHPNFNRMDDEYGRNLLLEWEKEPELMVEV